MDAALTTGGSREDRPLPLRPMLAICDRLPVAIWLIVVATALACPALLGRGSSSGRGWYLALTGVGYLLALWLALAVRWRTRHDAGLVLAALGAISAGDLRAPVETVGRGEIGRIAEALDVARRILAAQQEELVAAHTEREVELQSNYDQQRAAEGQVRQRAQAIIDETATAVVLELQGLIMQVDSVRRAAGAIEERVEVSDVVTRSVVDQAQAADAGAVNLSRSLRSVAEMAHLIQGVADQTKLLALNATIEAARAGSAGLGFSVVADEVKTLAVATANSTQQITSTIAALERDAEDVATAIMGVGGGIASLDEASSVLRGVAKNQFDVVTALDSALAATVERVEAMATLSERLERRHAERHPIAGSVEVTADGRTVTLTLIDLSLTGVRCGPSTDLKLDHGRHVRLRVRLEGAQFDVAAVVIRTNDVRSSDVGLAFAGVDPATLSVLQKLTSAQ